MWKGTYPLYRQTIVSVFQNFELLALLDYVSRAHEIKIHPSSVRADGRTSIRPWHQLSKNLLHGFLSHFGSCFPWAICPHVFWIKKKMFFGFFFEYFSFSLTWDHMAYLMVGSLSVVRRPCRNFLRTIQQIPLNFSCGLPWAIPADFFFFFFLNFWKKCIFKFFRIFLFVFGVTMLIWDPMQPKVQNATPPSNHFWIFSNFFSEFSSQ